MKQMKKMPQLQGGWVGVAIAGLGLISSFMGSRKAAAAAKDAAAVEAGAEKKVTTERLRQLGKEERVLAGRTRATAAGSGVNVQKGSPLQILAEQAREFKQERDVTRQVGATKAAQALQRGSDVATSFRYQGYSQAAQGAANIFSIINNSPNMYLGKQKGPG